MDVNYKLFRKNTRSVIHFPTMFAIHAKKYTLIRKLQLKLVKAEITLISLQVAYCVFYSRLQKEAGNNTHLYLA